ncbi:hypothetical protein [Phenylobacterium sp.]|uniref:hypothetical protein n=1 Tax=Phenylobacterium sp. TaxID=1871053 RepID=UPI0025D2E345|nr:hypothetical protein [Phenylobacterium sp.]
MSAKFLEPAPVALSRRDPRVRHERRRRRAARPEASGEPFRMSLWLPLTPFFWMLAPFVVLLAPLLFLAPPLWRINPYAMVVAIGRVLTSLSGIDVDVDAPDARVRIKIL